MLTKDLFNSTKKQMNELIETVQRDYRLDVSSLKSLDKIEKEISHHKECKQNIVENSTFNSYHQDQFYIKHSIILDALTLIKDNYKEFKETISIADQGIWTSNEKLLSLLPVELQPVFKNLDIQTDEYNNIDKETLVAQAQDFMNANNVRIKVYDVDPGTDEYKTSWKILRLTDESKVNEKWRTNLDTKPSEEGKWDGWTLAQLEKRRNELKRKEDRTEKETKELRQINFAIRAKRDWGKVKENVIPFRKAEVAVDMVGLDKHAFAGNNTLYQHTKNVIDTAVKNRVHRGTELDKLLSSEVLNNTAMRQSAKTYFYDKIADQITNEEQMDTSNLREANIKEANAHVIANYLIDIGKIISSGYPESNFQTLAKKHFGKDVASALWWAMNPDGDSVQDDERRVVNDVRKGIDRNEPAMMYIIANLPKIQKLAQVVSKMDNTKLIKETTNRSMKGYYKGISDILDSSIDNDEYLFDEITQLAGILYAGGYSGYDEKIEAKEKLEALNAFLKKHNLSNKILIDGINAAKDDAPEEDDEDEHNIDDFDINIEEDMFGAFGVDRTAFMDDHGKVDNRLRHRAAEIVHQAIKNKVYYFDELHNLLPKDITKDPIKLGAVEDYFSSKWDDEGTHINQTNESKNKTTKGTHTMNKITKAIAEGLELGKAETTLAVKSMADELQKDIEQTSKMQVEELLPIIERIKAEYGVEMAQQVESNINAALDMAVEALKTAKDTVENEALKLSGETVEPAMGAVAPEPEDDMDIDADLGDDTIDIEDEFGAVDSEAGPADEPLGRAKKEESKAAKGKKLTEAEEEAAVLSKIEEDGAIEAKVNKIASYVEKQAKELVAAGKFNRHYDAVKFVVNRDKAKFGVNDEVVFRKAIQSINRQLNKDLLQEPGKTENATVGATAAGSVASIPMAVGKVQRRRGYEETINHQIKEVEKMISEGKVTDDKHPLSRHLVKLYMKQANFKK